MQFKQALPHWEKAQAKVRRKLGDDLADSLMKLTTKITNALID
jgi:hypothetical protein